MQSGSLFRTLVVTLTVCNSLKVSFAQFDGHTINLNEFATPLNSDVTITNETYLFEKIMKGYFSSGQSNRAFMKVLQQLESVLKVSDDCKSDTDLMINDTTTFIKYIDSASKIPSGILQGKWNWVGDYQECHSIESLTNHSTGKSFKGKYFSAVLLLNGKPIFGATTVVLGVCLPDSCGGGDAKLMLNEAIAFIKFEASKIYPDIAKESLYVYEVFPEINKPLDSGATTIIVIIGLLCAIVLISTIVDYGFSSREKSLEDKIIHPRYDIAFEDAADRTELLTSVNIQENNIGFKHKILNVLCAFSFINNGKKLFGTETAVGPLAFLNGIRVLSMWWVILGHTFFFAMYSIDNPVEAGKLVQRFSFQPIINGTFSVDSFFFLSGLLVAYLSFKQIKEKGKLNWPYFILHRYWRLTPLYLFVILYYAFVMPFTITGPNSYAVYQPQFQESIDVCKKYWWTNILYINNFHPNYGNIQTTCIGWGWYLANDMQFYLVLGPIFIIALSLHGKLKYAGAAFITVIFLSGIIVRGVLVWYFGIYSLAGPATRHVDNPWAKNSPIYDKPYTRWPVYLIGMITGYILATTNNKIKLNKRVAAFGWCVAIATGLAVVYGLYYYNHHTGTHMTMLQSVCYIALSRSAWGLCLCWIVFACVSGNGGPVNDILSWKIWAPLGRLTYAAYLVHPVIMMTYNSNALKPLHYSDLSTIYLFVANLTVSYFVAFIVSMLIEAPMIQLEKLLVAPLSTFGTRFVIGPLSSVGSKLKVKLQRS